MDFITHSNALILFSYTVFLFNPHLLQAKCNIGCDVALASYYLTDSSNLTAIAQNFGTTISEVVQFNRKSGNVLNENQYASYVRISIPFSCGCYPDPDSGPGLAHTFTYVTQKNDRFDTIAASVFANLTTERWLAQTNSYPTDDIPDYVPINVTVNCSCGDSRVSKDFGLFLTYPLREGENLSSVAAAAGVPAELLQRYNLGVDFAAGSGLVFVPAKDQNGTFPPLKQLKPPRAGLRAGVIAGAVAASIAALLFLAFILYFVLETRKKDADSGRSLGTLEPVTFHNNAPREHARQNSSRLFEFQFKELAAATNKFMSNKIGEGGFGSVYYAELRGKKAAIKKMHKKDPREFVAELKVLGNVNHINLVRLIGYCIEHSLFLVYEFMENGNLSQHLRGSGKRILPWSTRLQIALDSARGLEYIHEHTCPSYIHRDIKPENILLDKDCRAKISDFGLTKLIEGQAVALYTEKAMGTWGYMPPEYIKHGSISLKFDVYSFGVVLYQLISAKPAIIEIDSEASTEMRTLRSVFEDVLTLPDPLQPLGELVDPGLGDDRHIGSIYQMALLAKACTREKPEQRPSMRSVAVALSILCSSTEDANINMFIGDPPLQNSTSNTE